MQKKVFDYKSVQGIIFDLDGTLIDSLVDIALCANEVLAEFGFRTHAIQDYKYFVGDGAKMLLQNALAQDVSDETLQMVVQRFKALYDHQIYDNTRAYDGILECLETLSGRVKLAILSNKPHEFTIKYAQRFFGHIPFEAIYGQIGEYKKPDPMYAYKIATEFGVPPSEIMFVGDTKTDMQTAKNSSMIACGVTWGFRPREELIKYGADLLIDKPEELLLYVKN